jgi:hypothetical protein
MIKNLPLPNDALLKPVSTKILYTFTQVYRKMGFTDTELQQHFAGPAFLAW